jgi:hypothetical protein
MEEPMKNKKLQLGMLAAVLVFGLMFISCTDTGGGSPRQPRVEPDKTINITGITGKRGAEAFIVLFSDFNDSDPTAIGFGDVSGNSVAIPLINDNYTPWNGSGSFYLLLEFDSDYDDDGGYFYLYTEGKTLRSLGISSTFTLDGQAAKIPKYKISSETSTIALSQFTAVQEVSPAHYQFAEIELAP